MKVIPAINETDFSEIQRKIGLAAEFGAEWIHLDVTDGKFTKNTLWNNPKDLQTSGVTRQFNIEVHLMIENLNEVIGDWIAAGVKRIVVHIESADDLASLKAQCESANVELVVAANPETPAQKLIDCQSYTDQFLVLAVVPGLAGQKFQENQLEKIKTLRKALPDAIIEVDGGVSLETAPRIKAAGADILVAASAIWQSDDPKITYQMLQKA